MTVVNKQFTYAGIKKQSALGAPATTPMPIGFGVSGGQVASNPISSAYEDLTLSGLTTSDRFPPGVNRTQILPTVSFSTRAVPNSLASFFLAALGTDAGTLLVHTETPALSLPYFTIFSKYGNSKTTRVSDLKMDSLKLGVKGTEPATLDVSMLGTLILPDATAFTAASDDTILQSLGPVGGTFTVDYKGASLVAVPISALTLEIKNNLQPLWLSSSIYPADIVEGDQTVEGTMTIETADLTEWQTVLTGTPNGTVASAAPIYGSFSFTLTHPVNGNIVMTAPRVEYICDFPASDPKGGPAEIPVTWRCVRPITAVPAFQAVITNTLTGAIT